jgi:nucleoid-associated protein YgaU
MGNFERLSVLVIVVIIVLIVVIALVQLTEGNEAITPSNDSTQTSLVTPNGGNGGTGEPSAMNGGVTIPPTPSGPAERKILTVSDLIDGRIVSTPPPAPPIQAPKPEPVVAREEPKVHVVQPGDTIAKIAKVHFATAVTKGTDAILKANPTVDPSRMRVGTRLTIPVLEGAPADMTATESTASGTPTPKPPSGTSATSIAPGGTYTTRKGDTLASIARRAYGRSDRWQDIWLANYDALGDDVDKPTAGIRLKIPR